ncbi:MAG TPA: acyl-CoA dehydrogenase family protein [Candidatus Limnocylindria bacterium]|nr:acyl-CoA dehydrogenase family protein [Candidatus Limnocylindria bacterium]
MTVTASRPARDAADRDAIRRSAVEFASRALGRDLERRDRDAEFSRDEWLACAAFGVQGLAIPAEHGGSGADLRTVMAVMEGLGEGCADNGLLFSLNAQMWSVEAPIARFGTPEQRARYLPGLASGALVGAHGMTEAESGSDAFSLRTTATRVDGGYVLRGRKTFITNAPTCDLAVAFATVDAALGVGGITAFIVERGAPGFEVARHEDKMGMRTSPMGDLVFDECRLPASARLGPEGAGAAIFNSSMAWERAAILSVAVGAMERELVRCVAYAKSRRQFGQPIGRFPAVASRVAEMKVRLEASRALLERVATVKDAGADATLEASVAKLFVSEAWVASSLDAQQVYGAYGYTRENGIEREVRDALASRIYSGTSDIQRLVIARSLGL